MTLTPRMAADFEAEAFNFIGLRELLRQEVYGDGTGVPTIGYGYALAVSGTLDQCDVDSSGRPLLSTADRADKFRIDVEKRR